MFLFGPTYKPVENLSGCQSNNQVYIVVLCKVLIAAGMFPS